jgi:hypothetical protein
MAIRALTGKLTASTGLIVPETAPIWQKNTAPRLPQTGVARNTRDVQEFVKRQTRHRLNARRIKDGR